MQQPKVLNGGQKETEARKTFAHPFTDNMHPSVYDSLHFASAAVNIMTWNMYGMVGKNQTLSSGIKSRFERLCHRIGFQRPDAAFLQEASHDDALRDIITRVLGSQYHIFWGPSSRSLSPIAQKHYRNCAWEGLSILVRRRECGGKFKPNDNEFDDAGQPKELRSRVNK